MYGVYSRAITKGRNNPDPNIEDLICVRSNQWCIRTQDSIKCKKLYTGLDRRILTCYNNALYPGIAKLVSRLVWECRGCIRDRMRRNAAKPCDTCVCWISPGCRKRHKSGFDHRNDHRQKKLCFYHSPWYHGKKSEYPGIAKLVSRLVWERDAPLSSRKIP